MERVSCLRVRGGLFCALVVVPLLALACSDDTNNDTTAGGTAGSGGSGATGGASGSGGTAGSGGTSGSSGSSGSGGAAGSAGTAGTGGKAGAGGSAGGGGSAGKDAGADTSAPDAAPDAAADSGPPPVNDAGPGGTQITPLSANGHDRLYGVVHDTAGNIYAVGHMADSTASTADYRMMVVKFLPTGALDMTFGTAGVASHNVAVGTNGENARGIVIQSTGKIVISGTVEKAGGDPRDRDTAIVRFTAQGQLDSTFGTGGVRILDQGPGEVTTDDGGVNIVAESTWGLSLFANDDLALVGSRKADGRSDADFTVAKLKADGTTDTTYATGGIFSLDINNQGANPRTATILTDGSVVGAGYTSDGGVITPVLWKLTPAGALDTTFGVAGVFNQPVLAAQTEAYGAALQGTSFVTAGYGRQTTSESLDFISMRVTATGTLDTGYGTGGITRVDVAGQADNARSVTILPDNRVLLVGGGRPFAGEADAMLAILTPDGLADTSFGPAGYKLYNLGGPNDFFWAGSVAPDKKSVAVVGLKGAATGGGDAGPASNDDAALLIMTLP